MEIPHALPHFRVGSMPMTGSDIRKSVSNWIERVQVWPVRLPLYCSHRAVPG